MIGKLWTKSTKSNPSGNCVQVRTGDTGAIQVRDSKLGDRSPVLLFTPSEWDAFLAGARNGEFDRP